MIVSATDRREKLKLFNICEVARKIGVDFQQLHRAVRSGSVDSPAVRIGKRAYFTEADLPNVLVQFNERNKAMK